MVVILLRAVFVYGGHFAASRAAAVAGVVLAEMMVVVVVGVGVLVCLVVAGNTLGITTGVLAVVEVDGVETTARLQAARPVVVAKAVEVRELEQENATFRGRGRAPVVDGWGHLVHLGLQVMIVDYASFLLSNGGSFVVLGENMSCKACLGAIAVITAVAMTSDLAVDELKSRLQTFNTLTLSDSLTVNPSTWCLGNHTVARQRYYTPKYTWTNIPDPSFTLIPRSASRFYLVRKTPYMLSNALLSQYLKKV